MARQELRLVKERRLVDLETFRVPQIAQTPTRPGLPPASAWMRQPSSRAGPESAEES